MNLTKEMLNVSMCVPFNIDTCIRKTILIYFLIFVILVVLIDKMGYMTCTYVSTGKPGILLSAWGSLRKSTGELEGVILKFF